MANKCSTKENDGKKKVEASTHSLGREETHVNNVLRGVDFVLSSFTNKPLHNLRR